MACHLNSFSLMKILAIKRNDDLKSFYFFKNELKELAFLVRTMHTGMHVGEVALQNSSWIKGTSNSKNISNSRRVNSDTTSH